jgi:hypothetical protein
LFHQILSVDGCFPCLHPVGNQHPVRCRARPHMVRRSETRWPVGIAASQCSKGQTDCSLFLHRFSGRPSDGTHSFSTAPDHQTRSPSSP